MFCEGYPIDIVTPGDDSTRMSAIKLGLLNVGGDDWKERQTADHYVTFSWTDLLNEPMKEIEGVKIVKMEGKPASST